MADPFSLMAISTGATAGGGILGAIGSSYSGQAKSNMYTYQAGVAQINKQIADQNAQYEGALGEVKAQQSGLQTQAMVGGLTAKAGASGLDINSGSKADVIASAEKLGQYDEAIVRSDAARKAYDFQVAAVQDEAQANLDMMAAKTSRTEGEIGAFSSLLNATGSVASKWYNYQNA